MTRTDPETENIAAALREYDETGLPGSVDRILGDAGTKPASGSLEDRIANALRHVFAERDRHDAICSLRDLGRSRDRALHRITDTRIKVLECREALEQIRASDEDDPHKIHRAKNRLRSAEGSLAFEVRCAADDHELIIRTYQEKLLRDSEAPLTPLPDDLPADVAALLRNALQRREQAPAANPPTREPDPAPE